MREATAWIARARSILADERNGLSEAAIKASRGGFAGGALWMQQAMSVVRSAPMGCSDDCPTSASYLQLGLTKYALAISGAALVAVVCWRTQPCLLPLAVVAFYLIEVRMVFAFPVAIDSSASPFRDSHELLRSTMPWLTATKNVMLLAAEMLFGGLIGRGFVRSWCVGCLAVVVWYEEARATRKVVV